MTPAHQGEAKGLEAVAPPGHQQRHMGTTLVHYGTLSATWHPEHHLSTLGTTLADWKD